MILNSMYPIGNYFGDQYRSKSQDFVEHYEKRVIEGTTAKGEAMFVCMNRSIAYKLYKEILRLRPKWNEKRPYDPVFPPGNLTTKQ